MATEQIIPIGEWLPDQYEYGNPGLVDARDVVGMANGYKVAPGLTTSTTGFMNERAQGMIAVIKNSDGSIVRYGGDDTDLWQLSSITWSEISSSTGAYTIDGADHWSMVRWQDQVFAANINDPIQEITIGGANFADLATSTLKPQAKTIASLERFVVIGNTSEGGTVYPYRVRWSAIDDPADWDQSATTQADAEDLEIGNRIQTIVPRGRDAFIFMDTAIYTMRYEGGATVFRFDLADQDRGALVPGGVVPYGNLIYYLAADGFFVFDGASSHPISNNRLNEWFLGGDNVNRTYLHRITATVDPERQLIIWAYPTKIETRANALLAYHWPSNRWSRITNQTLQNIGPSASDGSEFEYLFVDRRPADGDFSGGEYQFGAAVTMGAGASDNGSYTTMTGITGAALTTSSVTTGYMDFNPGKVTMLEKVRPIIEYVGGVGDNIQSTDITVNSVRYLTAEVTAKTLNNSNPQHQWGEFRHAHIADRFHQFVLQMDGDSRDPYIKGFAVEQYVWGDQ